jgi:hypothetical protein
MEQITVTNQKELKAAVSRGVFTQILLDGHEFILPKSSKMHDLEFVGKHSNTTVFLTGTKANSVTDEMKGYAHSQSESKMANQFNTVFSATCKNLIVTSKDKLELYFQTKEEFKQWKNITFDSDKIDVVIFTEEIDKALDSGPTTLSELESDLTEITIDFLEGVKQDCTDLLNSLS